jgi:ADP-ribosylglycohydrolase
MHSLKLSSWIFAFGSGTVLHLRYSWSSRSTHVNRLGNMGSGINADAVGQALRTRHLAGAIESIFNRDHRLWEI